MQKVHIIGIAGKATSAIAKTLLDLGWQVSGSDKNIYPPASTFLATNGILVSTPYDAQNVPNDAKLVIVGGNVVVDPNNPEVKKAFELGIEVLTYPQVLERFFIKENSIVVVGNYGKGTISGAITKVLVDLGHDPSYMVGGQMVDLPNNVHRSESPWSVMEGDEYPVPPLIDHNGEEVQSEMSKFLFYHPKYLLLTSAEWDHFDKFETAEKYIDAYRNLVQQLPADGFLVVNKDGQFTDAVAAVSSARVVTYSYDKKDADYVASDLTLDSPLLGEFNKTNLTGAYALLSELGFDQKEIIDSLKNYHGIVQRLQKVYEEQDLVVIRDYAHSPVKAQAAIKAVAGEYPQHSILAVFDIFASSLKNRAVLPELEHRFDEAHAVYLPKVDADPRLDAQQMVTGLDIKEAIAVGQPNVLYLPKQEKLIQSLLEYPLPKVVLLMSSGGMNGLEEELLAQIQTNHE